MKLNKAKTVAVYLLILLGMVGMATINVSAGNGNYDEHKIIICHVPPGNPENAHPIEVDLSAWEKGHNPHNAHNMDFVIDGNRQCGKPIPPVPEMSTMILTSAGLLGLLGLGQVSRKLRK